MTKRPSMVFPNPAGLTDGSRCVVQGQEGGTTTGTAAKSQRTPEGCQNHRRSSRSLKRQPSGTPPGCGFLASWYRWSAPSPWPTHRLLSCNPPGCGTGGGAPVTPGLTHQKCFAKEQKVVGNDKPPGRGLFDHRVLLFAVDRPADSVASDSKRWRAFLPLPEERATVRACVWSVLPFSSCVLQRCFQLGLPPFPTPPACVGAFFFGQCRYE